MKKLIFVLVLLVASLVYSSAANAHVLITDETKTKGAVLHIIPDDDPIAGDKSTLYFDMQDQLGSSSDSVKLTISGSSGTEQSVETKIDGTLVTAEFVFPVQDVYEIKFVVAANDTEYIFTQSQRVSRGEADGVLSRPTYVWAELLLVASGVGTALLIIIAINRRKDIAKHSSF